jgi:dipeptidyl aminopeptidase/acylaminoacyl peptidase
MSRVVSSLVAIAIALGTTPLLAQTKEPLTHERLWSFQRVGAPVVSPDGRWVVVSVTDPSYDPQQEVSDLWIVPADGSAEPRRLTSQRAGESAPAWSADSTRLAFAARRDGDSVTQIYVLDVAGGGEAQRVTNAPTAASAPRWRPDGRQLLFQAAIWPGVTDEAGNAAAVKARGEIKANVRIYERFPIRNFDRWLDDSRAHLWVVDVPGDRTARPLFAGTALARDEGFGGTSLQATWTPDGSAVLFVATDHADHAARATVTSSLWEVPAGGGEPRRVATDGLDVASPRFSPDGRSLCMTATDAAPAIYDAAFLACGPWPWSGRVVTPGRDLDRPVGSWGFSPDSQTIFFTAEDAGHERVYRVAAGGGAAALVGEPTGGVYTGLQVPERASAPMLFANWETATSPGEIVRIDPAQPAPVAITHFNTDKAAATDWAPLREFWFTGRDGRRIRSVMALPAGFDQSQRYPLLVLMHGGHASAWRDAISYRWNYHLLTQPGFVLIATDYRGSTGYGERFTLDILGDPLAGPADDINDAADEAIRRFPFIDGTRQAAAGASYGGHLANWLAGTTTRYKALVSHAGLATLDMQWATSDAIHHRELMMGGPPWERPEVWARQSPLTHAGRFRTPMLLSIGENDFRVPEGNTLAMYAALQRMQVPTRLLVWPDENHWILKGENSRVFYREVRAWLERHLGSGPV